MGGLGGSAEGGGEQGRAFVCAGVLAAAECAFVVREVEKAQVWLTLI